MDLYCRINRLCGGFFLAGYVVRILHRRAQRTLYFIIMLITCPAWFLPFFPLVPLVNGAIYALVALFIFKLRESSRCISQRDSVQNPSHQPRHPIK
jgi:Ca2+/Na+ antiporter